MLFIEFTDGIIHAESSVHGAGQGSVNESDTHEDGVFWAIGKCRYHATKNFVYILNYTLWTRPGMLKSF